MILPDFILTSRVNQHWHYSGMDSPEYCLDKKWFKQYPHSVEYHYNSRGFRDTEWPTSLEELKNSIWCIGDSFTLGLGSPIDHTWPWLLQKQTQVRTINVSMDGASNNWIARKAVEILDVIDPKNIVIHWSYITRREESFDNAYKQGWSKFYTDIKDPSWPTCHDQTEFFQLPQHIQEEIRRIPHYSGPGSDESRRKHYVDSTELEDINNTLNCINLLTKAQKSTTIIHSFIPNISSENGKKIIESHARSIAPQVISEFQCLDLARDGHHYDIKTSQIFVEQIIAWLNFV